MDKHDLEALDLELATFGRRATAVAMDKKLGTLERSAYLLLHHLSVHGPTGVKSLAEQFRLDISTISRQTAALESKLYIHRLPDPTDGRASSFEITESGSAELRKTKELRLARFAKLFEGWTPDESDQFLHLLAKLNRTFVD
ncbi:MarR family winged helix-turn-helix transcriptional regulator [Paenibacillus hodogayensis]|uniref:MarR family winged helix-turn-helix transcriptional regulator n=1 Tax=Paenibacillus hodogayensis TaxID=279208 RepID=A0ABV5W791_9BACL